MYFWADNLEKEDAQETELLGQIMHTDHDDLGVINQTFGNRAKDTLTLYSKLLDHVLKNCSLITES